MLSNWVEENIRIQLEKMHSKKKKLKRDFAENRITMFLFKTCLSEVESEIYRLEEILKKLEKSKRLEKQREYKEAWLKKNEQGR